MSQEVYDWMLLLGRWVHITTAVTWVGTSIFFMWLDRSFLVNPDATAEGHVGELWMVHGGGFYRVEKLLMGPTKVPKVLHWFKWEAYWTWLSGFFLVCMIFYSGGGTFLLDSSVSDITFLQGVLLSLFSIFGSWIFYDRLWEGDTARQRPIIGHFLTLSWFAGMTYFLCHTFSGRAAYIHIGGMLGTWMTANVFMRIIPRQLKMVEASKLGEPVNQEWGKNAKNRSTHNTYFTLPVIFIMLSNHFPSTYGHDYNWLILILLSAAGAAIREYFVVRLSKPKYAKKMAVLGVLLILLVARWTSMTDDYEVHDHEPQQEKVESVATPIIEATSQADVVSTPSVTYNLKGTVLFDGVVPQGKKLQLPQGCGQKGDVFSNEVMVNDGKLQNVFIRVIKGHEALPLGNVPESPVELDQRGCMYHPRVAAVRAGQEVVFINSDPIFHNVKSVTKENRGFNVAMPKQDQRITRVFHKPEMFLEAKCSVHPWMGAYITVVDHQYFDVSDDAGEFEISNLAPGEYTLEAWHELYGTQTTVIRVDKDSAVSFTFRP
ncbi:MAG: urate hydroxylase PuuD [bacterium]